jgi:hypothetical protein
MVMQENVVPGATVYTSDGDELGTVDEVRSEAFKVDVARMPDYWLPTDCVGTATATTVRLECSKDEVDEHKIDKPE